MTDQISEKERARILGAALDAVAWALLDDDIDTADRSPSAEHYQERVADARRILPSLMLSDDAVTAAIDARAGMPRTHCFLYATERCRCGEEWSDAHWMRFVLQAALSVPVHADGREQCRESGCGDLADTLDGRCYAHHEEERR